MFERSFVAGWGDMDFNAHMGNVAYLDAVVDTRLLYMASRGYPVEELARLRIGPVLFRDEVDYLAEVHLLEEVRITLALAGASPDLRKWRMRSEFFKADGTRAARVTSTGSWLDLSTRKLVHPPDGIRAALEALGRTEDFVEL